jgi:hypothetical protein
MILITATHGIGDFNGTQEDKVDLLGRLQAKAEATYPGQKVQVKYLAYEQYLDRKPVSIATRMAASAASAYYAGTPAVGGMLADYGSDIMEYYTSRRTRATVSVLLARELSRNVISSPEPIDQILLFGHSLGSLAILRLLNLLQLEMSVMAQAHKALVQEHDGSQLKRDLRAILFANKGLDGPRQIKVGLFGSPAFSRTLHGVKAATHKMALSESPVSTIVANQLLINPQGKAPRSLINVHSGSHFMDPLAGPAPDDGFINVNAGKVLHTDIEGHVEAMLADERAAALLKM